MAVVLCWKIFENVCVTLSSYSTTKDLSETQQNTAEEVELYQ